MTIQKFTPLLVLLGLYTALLIIFPLKIQPMEPYGYAAAAEGYYNLTATFAIQRPTIALPDISRYHPNHPLPHLIAAFLHSTTGVGALSVFKALNFLGALMFIFFFYLAVTRFIENQIVAVGAALALAFSYVFWGSALSGEMQMFGLGLMTGAVYFLIRYFEEVASPPRYLFIAAILYIFAGAFHLFTFILIFPAGFALLVHSRNRRSIKLYAIVLALIVAGYAFFYGLLLSLILNIHSLTEYLQTLFIYNLILLKNYPARDWWPLLIKSLFRAWVYTDGVWGFLPKCALCILILTGYWRLAKSQIKPAIKFLLLSWPVLQILLQIAVYGRPEGLNFWLFLFPTFYLSLAMAFEWLNNSIGAPLVAILVPLLLAATNFSSAVYANSSLDTEQVLYLRQPQLPKQTPVAFVVSEPVLTFGEIWTMGTRYGFKNQKVFLPCCGEVNTREKLLAWVRNQSAFIIVSDLTEDAVGSALKDSKIEFTVLQDNTGEVLPAWIPRSLYVANPRGTTYYKSLRVYSHAVQK